MLMQSLEINSIYRIYRNENWKGVKRLESVYVHVEKMITDLLTLGASAFRAVKHLKCNCNLV